MLTRIVEARGWLAHTKAPQITKTDPNRNTTPTWLCSRMNLASRERNRDTLHLSAYLGWYAIDCCWVLDHRYVRNAKPRPKSAGRRGLSNCLCRIKQESRLTDRAPVILTDSVTPLRS